MAMTDKNYSFHDAQKGIFWPNFPTHFDIWPTRMLKKAMMCLAETMATSFRQTHKHLAMDNQPLVANPHTTGLLILSKNLQICAP